MLRHRQMHRRGYSLLTVLMLLTLLAVSVTGLLFFITQSVRTSGAMLERRRDFYECDGMSRQLIAFTQGFLSENTDEDVNERRLRTQLASNLPNILPAGFRVTNLDVPDRELPRPVPVEAITNGPFAGMQAKIQSIDIGLSVEKTSTRATCRVEQSLSLGRVALFQFFVFADVPELDLNTQFGESLFARGRVHTNGRVCLGGANISTADGNSPFSVRLDSRVTAVENIRQLEQCGLGNRFNEAGIISARFQGEQIVGNPDRLGFPSAFDGLNIEEASGCSRHGPFCEGGWRSYSVSRWSGRVQDVFHTVPELTLPVSPPRVHVQLGVAANGELVRQEMSIKTQRPNTRFLVEPQLTNDPTDFGRNKLAFKAQIRIIDGVWYVKDPGARSDVDSDDGPWPGIPIWSDHPGSFTIDSTITAEGVEGPGTGAGAAGTGIKVGQADIRADLADRAASDPRFEHANWARRAVVPRAPPTPRRFSYYAYIDADQVAEDPSIRPQGPGLQYGRACSQGIDPDTGLRVDGPCDTDPPAVISYGNITTLQLGAAAPSTNQTYAIPAFRFLSPDETSQVNFNDSGPNGTGWCGAQNDFHVDDVRSGRIAAAAFLPIDGLNRIGQPVFSEFPVRGSPLPGSGTSIRYQTGTSIVDNVPLCHVDSSDAAVRRRTRLSLLEGTRGGFVDTNLQGDTLLRPGAQPNILPVNFDVHAFQEALADRTPGELGSYFGRGALWPSFDGSVFITNTWSGSQLGVRFPDGEARAMPNPQVDDASQPFARKEHTGPQHAKSQALPYPLCSTTAAGKPFVHADENPIGPVTPFTVPYEADNPGRESSFVPHPISAGPPPVKGSFIVPSCASYSLTTPGALASARPNAVRIINARTINFNADKCGPRQNQPCLPRLSTAAEHQLDDGMNVVTNVPLYVVGDVNQTSEVNNVESGTKADDWIPFMIGADTVTTLSNSWSDFGSRWRVATDDSALSPTFRIREASSTRYTMLLATGINASGVIRGGSNVSDLGVSGGGLTSVMRLMEDWSDDRQHTFRGSLVIGWNPIYTKWRVGLPSRATYRPPVLRDWQFDRHLNATVNQPPDTPVFDVTAVRSWRRE